MPALLHGTLLVTINGINRLQTGYNFNLCREGSRHNVKRCFGEVKRFLLCRPEIVGIGLYATVDLDKARVGRTRMVKEPRSPQWNESFRIYCAHLISYVIFTVKDDNPIGARLIGRAYIPVEQIINGSIINTWVELRDEDHIPIRGGSQIHVTIQFLSVLNDESSWSQGIKAEEYQGIPNTFFKQRQGCRVTLYQDAHVTNDSIPWIPLKGVNNFYKPQRCWEDIFDAIWEAKHLIYVAGWSVYTEIKLVRDPVRPKPQPQGSYTLGKLLTEKANEGVNVLVLVWDDRTSVPQLKQDGLMATHDQETEVYFRNTNVRCVLCPRDPGSGKQIVQGLQVSTMLTHHQKTIIVDGEVAGNGLDNKRRIISFVGGIDLCDGRYDILQHPLFWSLDSVHKDDFHQPNFIGASIQKGGPREPWHDIHCKLEGPIAWDVLYNFEQRWEKQGGDKKKYLIPIDNFEDIIIKPSPVTSSDVKETWNVQLFRSIDDGAVTFPKTPQEAVKKGLVSGKNKVMERSIQDAYINAIRRAKNFIYIENQYFLGSSFGWKTGEDIKVEDIRALHLIPKELSLKIVSKIEAGERFVVYIVIPMWPEGIPESASVQSILDWQRRTMEMMYTDVVSALKRKGNLADPRDYLTFLCLGNKEGKKIGEYTPQQAPETNSDYSNAQKSRRFMIYVHSKMMIVDDEYIIIGSANINQRSMDGGRDTEIAMGAYQPYHLTENWDPPMGQISAFRRALWWEHIGGRAEKFYNYPEREDCVRHVNSIAQKNWDLYIDDEYNNDLPSHLLRYPIEVKSDGSITTLPGHEFFPDTKACVLGTPGQNMLKTSYYLPPFLTT